MKANNEHITEAELEIMHILWHQGSATVKSVHEELNKNRDAVYTTTLKQLQVMFEKGLVTRDDTNRQHVYFPAVAQKKIQRKTMDKIVNTFFKGSASELILEALGQYKTSKEELDQIKSLIDKVKGGKK